MPPAPVGRHGELVPTIKTSSPSPIFAKDGENWAELALQKLCELAEPMLEVEYSREAYNNLFKGGYIKTPLKTVKMGSDQFAKLGRKDGGMRQSYIGAAYQTLSAPVVIVREGTDDIYIKSFIGETDFVTFMAVEKDTESGRLVVTNYRRHKKEVENKIKWAGGVVYIKDSVGGSPTKDETPSPEGGLTSP